MAPTPKSRLLVVVDASVVIAFCAKEPAKIARAEAELEKYKDGGWEFFAPAVMFSETLYVFCRQLRDGLMTQADYDSAVQNLIDLLPAINSPPHGEASLVERAEQIRGAYGCSRSSDSIYLALAEQLVPLVSSPGQVEAVTFDGKLENHVKANAAVLIGKVKTLVQ